MLHCYSHMVGYAGSPTYTAYVDMTRIQGQGQGQGHGYFELPTTSKAVHAGGDDRSPLAGLSGSCMSAHPGPSLISKVSSG